MAVTVSDADNALTYVRRQHDRLRPLVVVYCPAGRSHRVARVFRTRWGPFLWCAPIIVGNRPAVQDGLMDLSYPRGLPLLAGCPCGVQQFERGPLWQAARDAMADGRRRVLRARPGPERLT